MKLTEREAQTKVCPLSMFNEATKLCIGSRCMKWSWYDRAERTQHGANIIVLDHAKQPIGSHRKIEMRRGFCGL